MIELEKLSYTYASESNECLKDISLKAEDGRITLCTGVSGCGKSTIIRLMNGLCPHYYGGTVKGRVLIDGTDAKEMTLAEHSTKVGSLFQDPKRQFFALNVEDEIAFALEWQGIERHEIVERVNSVISRFSLESVRDNPIDALSEGQKQKVGLAAIVALGVKNIILDEPTANLDVESTKELALILNSLKLQGFCIFIVDHRLYYLKDFADKVIVMEDGRIVKEGGFDVLSLETVEKYGLRKPVVEDRRDTLKSTESDTENYIKTHALSFYYQEKKPVFNNLNLVFPKGLHVLLGRNGIGKTTLCRLMLGLEKAKGGRVEFNEALKGNPLSFGSIVLQNTDYQLNMRTVYSELESCFYLSGVKDSKEKIKDMLSMLDLSEFEKRHPQSLSGGQKQRLVIGMALCKKPKILILDEPTSGLDGRNMRIIKKMLKDYAAAGNCVVVITHDLELIDDDNFDAIRMHS
ncbi:MAG: ABC transporter ATP-binding protein [Succinivibrio sp.]